MEDEVEWLGINIRLMYGNKLWMKFSIVIIFNSLIIVDIFIIY